MSFDSLSLMYVHVSGCDRALLWSSRGHLVCRVCMHTLCTYSMVCTVLMYARMSMTDRVVLFIMLTGVPPFQRPVRGLERRANAMSATDACLSVCLSVCLYLFMSLRCPYICARTTPHKHAVVLT